MMVKIKVKTLVSKKTARKPITVASSPPIALPSAVPAPNEKLE